MTMRNDEHTELSEQDIALAKILAAMRTADLPQGMEARIAQRLHHRATTPTALPFRLRNMVANFALPNAWWRGAITGAAIVLVVTSPFLFAGHRLLARPDGASMATNSAANRNFAPAAMPVIDSSHGTPEGEYRAQPCPLPTIMRTASIATTYTPETLVARTRVESVAPSRPAPPLPLTAQERALVRLVQTSTPQRLAAISPTEYANLEAQSALKFEKFFAPPAPPPATDANAAAIPIGAPDADSEREPKRDPVPDPAVSSDENPQKY